MGKEFIIPLASLYIMPGSKYRPTGKSITHWIIYSFNNMKTHFFIIYPQKKFLNKLIILDIMAALNIARRSKILFRLS